jgi:hypothetical protein
LRYGFKAAQGDGLAFAVTIIAALVNPTNPGLEIQSKTCRRQPVVQADHAKAKFDGVAPT